MSSTPEPGEPAQWGGAQQSTQPGQRAPGQGQYGSPPSGDTPGQPSYGGYGQWGSQPGWASPVHQAETRVTWRRIFQYWIDSFFVSIVPYLVSIPFDRSGRTLMNVLGGVIYVVLFVLIGLWYWVIWPHSHSGQTFAMKWFGLRVISKDGGPASITQMFVRWVSLLIDAAPWMWPLTGLLGLIVMLCSRYRQRVGDHLARTLVVSTSYRAGARSQFAAAGAPGEARLPASACLFAG